MSVLFCRSHPSGALQVAPQVGARGEKRGGLVLDHLPVKFHG